MNDMGAIFQTGFSILIASFCVYIAWFKPEILRRYLQLWSKTQFVGRNWMKSDIYFWLMRGVTIFMLIVAIVSFVAVVFASN